MSQEITLLFWAKRKKETGELYPLLYHMLDTYAVTYEMWNRCLHRDARKRITENLGLSEVDAGRWLAFLSGLHDIGKASPGFQCHDDSTMNKLKNLGFDVSTSDPGHGLVAAVLLHDFLKDLVRYGAVAHELASAIGGHHGVFPRSVEMNSIRFDVKWKQAQRGLYDAYGSNTGCNSLPHLAEKLSPAFFMFLAGLTSVADWIASNDERCFPYPVCHGVNEHIGYARDRAAQALETLIWTGWQPPSDPAEFQRLFNDGDKPLQPRPLQRNAITLAETLKGHPGLVIIEAPMGEGKTEAAIYLADCWTQNLGQKGCYFALPTMATSDQMFGRVKQYLQHRYHDDRVNFMLLHGHAALSAEFEKMKKSGGEFTVGDIEGEPGHDRSPAGIVASEWFTYRKRGLLAPFGVGTIDQVLLAVLQTRHVFVRLFGLANKTVIIDEIHAYDAYMTTLLERLLEWLAALGTSVVMLSATLPRSKRDNLLRAYVKGLIKTDKDVPLDVAETSYPRISWTTGGEFGVRSFDAPASSKTLKLKWVDGRLPEDAGEYALGEQLREALSEGGCAAVIYNTVDRAQEMYKALKSYFPGIADDGQQELDLLHARFMYGDRKKREERSLIRFGRSGSKVQCEDGEQKVRRPNKAVLVSTQIIEQSLDLDFDLIVTDMAPVDLLLQRAGRMHRHQRKRPEKLKTPTLWICKPDVKDNVPSFGGGTEAVYDPHILLRSWLAIKDKTVINIPDDIENLIEEVYGERDCPEELPEQVKKKWEESRKKLDEDIAHMEKEAEQRRIKWPGFTGQLWRMTYEPREEDDPGIHQAHQALTRLGDPSVNVICLYGTAMNACLDRVMIKPVDFTNIPVGDHLKTLLSSSVLISRRGLVGNIENEQNLIPEAWRKSPMLRHHYILYFDQHGICTDFPNLRLCIDDERGLVIEITK